MTSSVTDAPTADTSPSSVTPDRWRAATWSSPAATPSLRPGCSMWRDAVLVAGKDLRIELRSRVALNQVAPFGVLVLVLFAFALDPDRGVLVRTAAGLFW